MVMKKKTMRSSGESRSTGSTIIWAIVILGLKVLGIALLVQGFIVQLASGFLFQGMVHYTLGAICGILAWHFHKRKCLVCK